MSSMIAFASLWRRYGSRKKHLPITLSTAPSMAGLIAFGDGGCSLTIFFAISTAAPRGTPAARGDLVIDHTHREDVRLRRHRLVRRSAPAPCSCAFGSFPFCENDDPCPSRRGRNVSGVQSGQLHLAIRGDEHRVAGDIEVQYVLGLHQLHRVGELIDDAKELRPIRRAASGNRSGDRKAAEPTP